MARRKKIRSAADEIDPCSARVLHAAAQQRRVESATAECGVGRGVREISHTSADKKGCSRSGLTFAASEIKRPARLTAPGSDVFLELVMSGFGNAPTQNIGREELLQLFS